MTIPICQERSHRPTTMLALGSAAFVADALGALYWPEERLLVVADLHLEKGSAYAARRVFLPPYDTATTLAALAVLIARYAPRTIVALGDSFHDVNGSERLPAQFRASLRQMQAGRHWIWIAGNHDPVLPEDLGGARQDELAIGNITLRHEPRAQHDGFRDRRASSPRRAGCGEHRLGAAALLPQRHAALHPARLRRLRRRPQPA